MALGPKKFVKKSIEEDRLTIDKLEKRIDNELEKRYSGEQFFVVETGCICKSVVDELKKKYLQAGWTNVEYYPREGRFGEWEGGYLGILK